MDLKQIKHNEKAQLDLIPLGRIDPLAIDIVAANIQAVLGLNTDILAARSKPQSAFLASRNQLDAAKILKLLSTETGGAMFKLAITSHDLCLPILTYVYGESQLGGKAAVVSLYRLNDVDRQITYARIAKVSIHEIGHVLGLEHCWEAGCLMRFSKQLDQLDRLPLRFCSACEYEMVRRLQRIFRNSP